MALLLAIQDFGRWLFRRGAFLGLSSGYSASSLPYQAEADKLDAAGTPTELHRWKAAGYGSRHSHRRDTDDCVLVRRALGLGMASEQRTFDHVTKYISRLDPFSAAGVPHSEAAPVGAIGVLAAVQIAVKPISQTRCQPDNSEQNEKQKDKE